MTRVEELRARLGLVPHPERGFYAETYRSPLTLDGLPHGGPRAASTAIYFLLTAEEPRTYLHRLRSDEIFHLYEGGPLEVLLLRPDDSVGAPRLGLDLARGERPQLVVPAGTWFAAELDAGASHALFGCTVAPGFEFADLELAPGTDLLDRYPAAASRLARFLLPQRGGE